MKFITFYFASLWIVSARVFNAEDENDDYVRILQTSDSKVNIKERLRRDSNRYSNEDEKNNSTAQKIVKNTFIFENDSNNVAFVYWKNSEANVVFILTCQVANTSNYIKLNSKGCSSKSNFYRSTDHGETYEKKDFGDAFLHSIYLTPLDKSFKIATDFVNKNIYISNDAGNTFRKIKVNFSPTFIHFHPNLKDYIAAFDNSINGKKSLYISEDRGETWKLVSKYVLNYFWAVKGIDKDLTLIHFEKETTTKLKDGGKDHYATQLFISRSPYEKNVTHIVLDSILVPYSVYIGKEFIVVQLAENERQLYVCNDREKFYEMIYSNRKKSHLHYIIFDSNQHELLMGIVHDDNTMSLYLSDKFGRRFYLIQANIFVKASNEPGKIPTTDFYKINGVKNSYIVNKRNDGTLITHDKGLTWKKPVLKSSEDKQPIHCAPNCSLILYIKLNELYSDFTARIQSKESAPGVILAQGYIGKVNDLLSRIQAENFVYISTDGGYTWSKTLEALYGYSILDHGGLITATPLKFTIDHEVSFSTNYGKSWSKIHMTRHYSRIAAIISESTGKTQIINVFGFLQEQTKNSKVPSNTWIVWQFKFNSLFDEKCSSQDYEDWNHNNDKCMLGMKYINKRRKIDNVCSNGHNFNGNVKTIYCQCTYKDFACEKGFMVKHLNGYPPYRCEPINPNHTIPHESCKEKDTYYKTRGYYKIFGNKCTGGVESEISPVLTECPLSPPVIIDVQVSSHRVYVHETITFNIKKVLGYRGTHYTWNFGDSGMLIEGSYKEVENVYYSYQSTGQFNVTLKAQNEAGSYVKHISINVLDNFFENLDFIYEEPIMQFVDNEFTVESMQSNQVNVNAPKAFYSWYVDKNPIRKHEPTAVYNCPKSGYHTFDVVVSRGATCKTISKEIYVYKKCIKILMNFSDNLQQYSTSTKPWVSDLKMKLKTFLAYKYDLVDENQILVRGNINNPTEMSVFLCDKNFPDNDIETLTFKMLTDINNNKPIFGNYEIPNIRIVSADTKYIEHNYLTMLTSGKESSSQHSWIYVVIALILVVIFATLIYLFRKKNFKEPFFRFHKDSMKENLVLNMDEPDENRIINSDETGEMNHYENR